MIRSEAGEGMTPGAIGNAAHLPSWGVPARSGYGAGHQDDGRIQTPPAFRPGPAVLAGSGNKTEDAERYSPFYGDLIPMACRGCGEKRIVSTGP